MKTYYTNLGIYPIATYIEIDNDLDYISLYNNIDNSKNRNLILHIQKEFDKWSDLSWLTPKLVSNLYYVTIIFPHARFVTEGIACNSIIVPVGVHTIKNEERYLQTLRESDYAILDIKISEVEFVLNLLNRQENNRFNIMFNDTLTYQELVKKDIYNIPILILEKLEC